MRDVAAEQGLPFEPERADNLHRLNMGVFPEGATLIPNPYNKIPGFSVGSVHFVPGFPVMAWPMIEWVLDTPLQAPARPARAARALDHRLRQHGSDADAADGRGRAALRRRSRCSACPAWTNSMRMAATSNWASRARRRSWTTPLWCFDKGCVDAGCPNRTRDGAIELDAVIQIGAYRAHRIGAVSRSPHPAEAAGRGHAFCYIPVRFSGSSPRATNTPTESPDES